MELTLVDRLQLGDDVQPDIGELVLQQLQEEGQQVFNRGIFAEQRGQAADLGAEGGSDVLRRI